MFVLAQSTPQEFNETKSFSPSFPMYSRCCHGSGPGMYPKYRILLDVLTTEFVSNVFGVLFNCWFLLPLNKLYRPARYCCLPYIISLLSVTSVDPKQWKIALNKSNLRILCVAVLDTPIALPFINNSGIYLHQYMYVVHNVRKNRHLLLLQATYRTTASCILYVMPTIIIQED